MDDVSVGIALVDTYMKTRNVGDGRRVFDEIGERNVVSWTSLLSCYARNVLNGLALEFFCLEVFDPNFFYVFEIICVFLTAMREVGNGY